ncbi:hypothetical protein KFL_008860020 [Klebsormidium nitens]|uniref:Uncharacterized protein n=1 Tax=Klebsormidium nitens TaxID=105231 RepID=A0A1Y1IT08_KLENI|nr:hypothetical protein KFL_008860020 [Klebsormidium nitens]|eukprot:GAQ91936.1 hypothetical protein KFL_008860020 [Klebsormidium nitens]
MSPSVLHFLAAIGTYFKANRMYRVYKGVSNKRVIGNIFKKAPQNREVGALVVGKGRLILFVQCRRTTPGHQDLRMYRACTMCRL